MLTGVACPTVVEAYSDSWGPCGSVGTLLIGNHSGLEAPTNWSAISTCAILAAGYATDDEGLINTSLYGLKGTKEQPTGGLYLMHFGAKSMSADGLWAEGAMGYQFMALQALVTDAEILQAQATLAKSTGIFTEPAGAAALAGLVKLQQTSGRLPAGARTVLLATGNGLKDVEAPLSLISIPQAIEPRLESVPV